MLKVSEHYFEGAKIPNRHVDC